jgi:trimeric autotransporter adhesin
MFLFLVPCSHSFLTLKLIQMKTTLIGAALLFIMLQYKAQNQVAMLVRDIVPGNGSPNITELVAASNKLFFVANDGITGLELWVSDGTLQGTSLVKDIFPLSQGSGIDRLMPLGGMVMFGASGGPEGRELWKSDGTLSGTTLVKDIYPGAWGSMPSYVPFAEAGGKLYFTAMDSLHGSELWSTDGSTAGTSLVKDLGAGTNGVQPFNLSVLSNTVFFYGSTTSNGDELFSSDGTSAGTIFLKDIFPGTPSSNFMAMPRMTPYNGKIYFQATPSVNNYELWSSDNTLAGTAVVKDVNPAGSGMTNGPSAVSNNLLFFVGDDGSSGAELWKSDGTSPGTQLVKDIYQGFGGSSISRMIDVNGTLYFMANDGVNGLELWKSDGTPNGTSMVKDINPGSGSALNNGQFSYMAVLNGKLYFNAENGQGNNLELWVTDGSATGTTMFDINTNGSSQPKYLTVAGGKLFFVADNGNAGQELYTLVDQPVGLESENLAPCGIYPNPGTGDFYLDFPGTSGTLQLFDYCGKEVHRQQLLNGSNHISSALGDGLYLFRVTADDGNLRQGRLLVCHGH